MVRPLDMIQRDIDGLTEATVSLAAEFRRLYSGYLDSLGVAVRRQVVMATYHLCTQVYPEAFLALSLTQREKLQRDVRDLGRLTQTQLGQLLDALAAPMPPAGDVLSMAIPDLPSLPSGPEAIRRFLPEAEDSPSPDWREDGHQALEYPTSETDAPGEAGDQDSLDHPEDPEDPVPLPSILKSMVMAALAEEIGDAFSDPLFTGDAMTPTRLAKQHIFLEQQIRDLLQHLSKQVNQRLQEAQVIPSLPEAILDAASETEMGSMRGRAVPNVLSVLVAMAGSLDDPLDEETPSQDENDPDDPDDSDRDNIRDGEEEDEDLREGLMTHLAAVNLRLPDLEFSDVQSSMGRSKLRTALGHLRKLGKQYQKVQRERAIAEAEQAWRTVWYDES